MPMLLISGVAAIGAEPAASASAAPQTRTNAAPAVPQSVFVIPATSQEGRDPFFPDRIITTQTAKTNVAPVVHTDFIKIDGFSFSEGHPLVIINHKTLAEGECADVPYGNGKIRVCCIQIQAKNLSAIIEVAGERQELHFKD